MDANIVEKESKADEKVIEIETAPEAAKPPTREDMRAKGWSKDELDKAEKRGMLSVEEKKPEEKPEDKAAEAKPETKQAEERQAEKKPTSLPDFNLTAEQEEKLKDVLPAGTPLRGVYFRLKGERSARQKAEAQVRELAARLETLEKNLKTPVADADVVDEDAPLTLKAIKELQQREAEENERIARENNERHAIVTNAQLAQEEYVKSVYEDFNPTVALAKEVVQNFEAMFPEKHTQTKVVKLIRDLQVAAAQADRLEVDEYNAAFIMYELGKLHPNHGKRAETTELPVKDGPKASGGQNTGRLDRIVKNTQRNASSASLPDGSGKRVVAVSDVDLAVLNAMSYKERQAFKDAHPAEYAKLLRG